MHRTLSHHDVGFALGRDPSHHDGLVPVEVALTNRKHTRTQTEIDTPSGKSNEV